MLDNNTMPRNEVVRLAIEMRASGKSCAEIALKLDMRYSDTKNLIDGKYQKWNELLYSTLRDNKVSWFKRVCNKVGRIYLIFTK